MEKQEIVSIARHFESLPDPHTGNAEQHIFWEVLMIAICAVICGADGWSDKEERLANNLSGLTKRPPFP